MKLLGITFIYSYDLFFFQTFFCTVSSFVFSMLNVVSVLEWYIPVIMSVSFHLTVVLTVSLTTHSKFFTLSIVKRICVMWQCVVFAVKYIFVYPVIKIMKLFLTFCTTWSEYCFQNIKQHKLYAICYRNFSKRSINIQSENEIIMKTKRQSNWMFWSLAPS